MKKNRFSTILATLMIAASLAACGGSPAPTPAPTSTTAAPTSTTAAAPTSTSAVVEIATDTVVAVTAEPTATSVPEMTATTAPAKGAALPTATMEVTATVPLSGTESTPTEAMAAPTASSETATPATGGETTPTSAANPVSGADLGFRSNPNGFSFPNYSGDYPNTPGTLTLAAVRKMFGDAAVCASVNGSECTPRQEATMWLDEQNKGLNGGSCEGFAVAALRMFKGELKPNQFDPNARTAYDLKLDDTVRGQLAADWALQGVEPVSSFGAQTRTKTPSEILAMLTAALSSPGGDQYTLGIWHGKEGHAVLPYSVEDKGNGIFWIHVYDNNYPGDDKYVEIDRNANTWKYALAAVNPAADPSPWGGGPNGDPMDLTSLSVRDGKLVCPWCAQGAGGGLLQAQGQSRQLWLDGKGDVLITDSHGHRLGYQNGRLVNEIPGAYDTLLKGTAIVSNHEPIFYLPESGDYQISFANQNLPAQDTEEIATFGQGMAAEVQNIKVDNGANSSLNISADGTKLDFKAGEAESPDFKLAMELGGKDYQVEISDLAATNNQDISLSVDENSGKLAVKDSENQDDHYSLTVTEEDSSGIHTFKNKDVDLSSGSTDYVDFGAWDERGPLKLEVDQNSDGSIDQTVDEQNQP